MINARFAGASDAEGNVAHHFIHDLPDGRSDLRASRIGEDGKVAASDVEADTRERDFVLVSHHAADRLRVTFVSISAKHAALAARSHAGFDLCDRRFIML